MATRRHETARAQSLRRACICVAVASFSAASAWAADAQAHDEDGGSHTGESSEPRLAKLGTLQVDPLTTALGFAHLQGEFVLARHWSIYAGPSVRAYDSLLGDKDGVRGVGIEAGLRYYFGGAAPAGAWVLLRGVAARTSLTGTAREATGFGGYVSGLGGYTWLLEGGPMAAWVFSLGAGVQYVSYRAGGEGTKSVLPAAHTTVGFAF